MSDLDKILEEQKLRLKQIRDRVNRLTEDIQLRKSGISAELFASSKDKMSEFSPSVFAEIQNLLLEEIAKGYEAIVTEKEKVIQQLQKDIEEISLKYSKIDSVLKEQMAKISVLSEEKDKSVVDLLKKVAEITHQNQQIKTDLEEKNVSTVSKEIIKSNFDFSYQILNEVVRYFRTRRGMVEEALNIVKTELNDHPSYNKIFFMYEEISRIIDILLKCREAVRFPETLILLSSELKSKNISVIKEIEDSNLYVLIDRNLVIVVLKEIIMNSVESFIKPTNNKITIKLLKEKDNVKLKIIDNGHGIAEHLLPKVFSIFFTTKVDTNHFGLGLFKAYWYIKLFNGEININSFFGQGTEVELIFPISKEE
jgi:signal transduction histidine kinase